MASPGGRDPLCPRCVPAGSADDLRLIEEFQGKKKMVLFNKSDLP